MTNENQGSSKNEIIKLEKDSSNYADYHGLERPGDVANTGSMKYAQLVNFFDNISAEKNVAMRYLKLVKLFDYHREHYGNDFYNLLRLMIPERERERHMFGIKETVLAKIYVELLGLSKKHRDGERLLTWKAPTATHTVSGDFASVLIDVMKTRVSYEHPSDFTIDQVNERLDALSRARSFQQKKDIMKDFARNCNLNEQFWLVRILLKNLKISIRERSILSRFHPDAYALFEVSTDLRTVAYKLYDHSIRLRDADSSVSLFQVFQPMLCKRNTIAEVQKKMPKGLWIVEEKMDGERIQLHKKGNRYKYWSRKAKDYTYLYGKSPQEGSLTPHIHSAFDKRVDEVVLDGEMLAYSGAIDGVLPFGTLKGSAKGANGTYPIFKVFDVLWVNGKDISEYPLKEREKTIHSIFTPIPTRIEHVSRWTVSDVHELKSSLERIILQKGEGLVVKSPISHYEYGGRSDKWIKLKPDYFDEMSDTTDLLVIGGNWSNSRNGVISTLFCALVDNRTESETADAAYITLARVGTGYTAQDLEIINRLFSQADTRKYTPASVYPGVKIGLETPDIIINPEQSFVVEIKASDINPSVQYPTGFTYRFPRFKRLRLDKGGDKQPVDPDAVFKWTEMEDMIQGLRASQKKHAQQKIESKVTKPTRKKQIISSRAVASVRADMQNCRSTLFEGCAFRILNGNNELEVKDLAILISERKGMVLSKIPKDAECPEPLLVIAGKATAVQVTQLIKMGRRSVLAADWLLDCVKHNCIVPLEGEDSERHWVYKCDSDADTITNTLRPFFVAPGQATANAPQGHSQGMLDEFAVEEINDLRFTQEPALQMDEPTVQSAEIEQESGGSETETENEHEHENDQASDDNGGEGEGENGDGDATIDEDMLSQANQAQQAPIAPPKPIYKQTSSTRTVTRHKGSTSNGFDDSSDEDGESGGNGAEAGHKHVEIAMQPTQPNTPSKNRLSALAAKPTESSPSSKDAAVKEEASPTSPVHDDVDPDLTLDEPVDTKTSGTPAKVSSTARVGSLSRRTRGDAFDSDSGTDIEDAPTKKTKQTEQVHANEVQRGDEQVEKQRSQHPQRHQEPVSAHSTSPENQQDHSKQVDARLNGSQGVTEETEVSPSDDPNKPLLNVVAYFDDYENAITNDLFPRPSLMGDMDWSGAVDKFTCLGGRSADLDDEKLTHIVIDNADKERVEELFERTKRPKYRKLTIPGSATANSTAIYKDALWGDNPRPDLGVKTTYDLFQYSLARAGDKNFLGHRPYNPSKGRFERYYEYQSYNEVAQRRTNLGSGISELVKQGKLGDSTQSGWTAGTWSKNCPEWQIADLSLHAYSRISVPLYDTLGNDSVEYVINHSEIRLVFTSSSHLPQLYKILQKCPTVKAVIVLDGLDEPGAPQDGARVPGQLSRADVLKLWAKNLDVGVYSLAESGYIGSSECMSDNTQSKSLARCTSTLTFLLCRLMSSLYPTPLALQAGRKEQSTRTAACAATYWVLRIVLLAPIAYTTGDILRLMEDLQIMQPEMMVTVPRVLNRIYAGIKHQMDTPGVKGSLLSRAVAAKVEKLHKTSDPTHMLWDKLIFNKIRQVLGGKIKIIITGSAPISPEVLDVLKVSLCIPIVEGYGLTEASICVRTIRDDPHSSGCVGPVVPGFEIKLKDVPEMNYYSTDQPYPRGEICIKSPSSMKEYYKDEAKTRETFTEDGFLLTGDIGQFDKQGRLKLIDRKKNIVKLAQGEFSGCFMGREFTLTAPSVHADSLRSYLVAVVVPDPIELSSIVGCDASDRQALDAAIASDKVRGLLMAEIDKASHHAGLKGFERIKAVHITNEQFTIDNGLLTPTLKVKGNEVASKYQSTIEALYKDNDKAAKL
ncbi:hypothetical protein E3P99_01513 [Wallemia hederae]|uniref:DNA ligase n=1 Tax=Wallemia hederae TaxID=1540922 RepID=A0A4T0FQ61_9BASI|nr:hypothetical protein E3P99_01513 [Wallemia hederae]